MIDYERMQRRYPAQKRALTLAIKSGDCEQLVSHCRAVIAEWDEIGAWPDDWARWQRALNDAFPWPNVPQLDDLVPA